MDKRLEEQLERVRQLSQRVGQIHEDLARNTALMRRDREQLTGSPLERAKDVRRWRGADAADVCRPRHAAAAERPRRAGRQR
ncbi:MAG: hypothetical protein U0Q55_00900 [Vicinamibacterales bacterium]